VWIVKLYTRILTLGRYRNRLRVGRSGFDSWQGQEVYIYYTVPRPGLALTQPPVQWVHRARVAGRESDHSLPSSAELWRCKSDPVYNYLSTWTNLSN
jgi:hypothetical protein